MLDSFPLPEVDVNADLRIGRMRNVKIAHIHKNIERLTIVL